MTHIDVVVIGAGPTGCMLAGELAAAGRSVTVLDKRAAPSTLSRAFGVHARTLELLDARGLADRLVATGAASPGLKLWRGAALNLGRLRSRFPFVLVTPQRNVDTLLEEHARDRGADIIRGFTVTGVSRTGTASAFTATTVRDATARSTRRIRSVRTARTARSGR